MQHAVHTCAGLKQLAAQHTLSSPENLFPSVPFTLQPPKHPVSPCPLLTRPLPLSAPIQQYVLRCGIQPCDVVVWCHQPHCLIIIRWPQSRHLQTTCQPTQHPVLSVVWRNSTARVKHCWHAEQPYDYQQHVLQGGSGMPLLSFSKPLICTL